MLKALDLLHSFIAIIMLVPGTALNSFIISIYSEHWRKKQCFTTCDQIFLSTALTNLVLQWFSVLINLAFYVFITLPHIGIIYLYTSVFFFCMSYFCFWNTAWLSIHYCLKLVNFSSSFLTWLKAKFASSMTQVIIASLVWVLIISFPIYWTVALVENNVTNSSSVTVNFHCLMFNVLLGCVLPFIKTFICIGLSVMYLLRHVRKIKQNESTFSSSPQVNGHVQAVRTMILQVFLNAALQMAMTGRIVWSFNLASFSTDKVLEGISEATILTYPSAEALTLIIGNPKIKSRLLRKLNVFAQHK